MKVVESFVLALLMCASFAFSANWQPAQTDPSQCLKPQKILFIGNSFTFQGPVPDIVKNLAVDAGINRIAIPAEEAIERAKEYGLEILFKKTCCSVSYS